MRMKQKKPFFCKKKKKSKSRFSKSPILKKISQNFHRLVPGLVELIDAKGIDGAQRIWPGGCPT